MAQKMSQQKHSELKDLRSQHGTANWNWGGGQIHSRITLGDAFAETFRGVFDIFKEFSCPSWHKVLFKQKYCSVHAHDAFLMGGRGWRVFAGWTHSSMERVVKYLDEQTGIRKSLCSERWIEVGTGPWAALGAQLSSPGCGQHLLSWSMPAQGFALPFPFPWLRFVPADRNCREWHRWKAKGCFIFLWHSL